MAVAGGFLVHLTLGTVFSFGNLTSYMTSYIRARLDPGYSYEEASWIYTGNMIARGVFTVVGGSLEYRIGPRSAAVLGCTVATVGTWTTAFSIQRSSMLLVFTQGVLFGAGIGLAYIGPLTCGMKWFPERKGMVSGIVVGGFGLGSFIFSPIQTMFLNPRNISVNKSTGYFDDEDILNRVPTVFHLLGGLYAALQIIACWLLRDPPEDLVEADIIADHQYTSGTYEAFPDETATNGHAQEAPRNLDVASIEADGQFRNKTYGSSLVDIVSTSRPNRSDRHDTTEAPTGDRDIESSTTSKHNQDLFEDPSLAPLEMLRCKEFYMLFTTFFFNQQAIGYATMMYKPFGQRFIDDDRFLTVVGSLASVFNALGRMFWGAFADRTRYRTAMLVLTCLLAALYSSLEATIFGGRYMYAVWILLIYFTFSGTFALLPPATSQTFGPTYAGPNYGLVYCNGILAPIFQSFVLEQLTGKIGSIGILLITAGCAACSFVITVFYDRDPGPAKIRASHRRHDALSGS